MLENIKGLLKNTQDPVKAIESLQDENQRLQKELENLKKEQIQTLKNELKTQISNVKGVRFLAKKVPLDVSGMKDIAFQIGGELDDVFIVLGGESEGKAFLLCYISKPLVKEKGLNAGQVVRELGKYIQGGGGGQPFFATAGGKNPEGINKALEEAVHYLGQ